MDEETGRWKMEDHFQFFFYTTVYASFEICCMLVFGIVTACELLRVSRQSAWQSAVSRPSLVQSAKSPCS